MTRPDVACLCVDLGIHVAITVYGEGRDRAIEAFIADHSGPGHLPISPTKDWHGRAGEFRKYLERVRRELAALSAAEDVERVDPRDKTNIATGGRL